MTSTMPLTYFEILYVRILYLWTLLLASYRNPGVHDMVHDRMNVTLLSEEPCSSLYVGNANRCRGGAGRLVTPRLPRLFLRWSSCRLHNPRASEMLNNYRAFA